MHRYVELAGGKQAAIVVIPTASGASSYDQFHRTARWFSCREAGSCRVSVSTRTWRSLSAEIPVSVMAGHGAIYDHARQLPNGGKFYLLSDGDRFNLATREATRERHTPDEFWKVEADPW